MTEVIENDDHGFPGLQVGTFIKGDHFVIRASSAEEFDELLKGYAEKIESILESLNSVKQAVVAKGILSGDSAAGGKTPAKATGRKVAGKKAADAPPPGDIEFYVGDDGRNYASVECKHGPMLDFRDRDYQKDLYCTAPRKEQCPAVKL